MPPLRVRKALCLSLLLAVAPASGLAQRGAPEAMADAMMRMMEAMGLFDSRRPHEEFGSRGPMSMMGPLGASGWGSVRGPWGDPVEDGTPRGALLELMRRFAPQAQGADSGWGGWGGGGWDRPWTLSRLEGVWEGRDGELLIVQGGRFRIYSRAMQKVDGHIEIRDDRLALYNPATQHTKPFEFAESGGRLIMRGLEGNLYLYRRLRLDGWPTGDTQP